MFFPWQVPSHFRLVSATLLSWHLYTLLRHSSGKNVRIWLGFAKYGNAHCRVRVLDTCHLTTGQSHLYRHISAWRLQKLRALCIYSLCALPFLLTLPALTVEKNSAYRNVTDFLFRDSATFSLCDSLSTWIPRALLRQVCPRMAVLPCKFQCAGK
ncbi:hypothetical protein EDB83DRAFT_251792 [Lactarius deliciosus]|nr:hypothetical protein EDB83DRAFT_251792 [Lactarius deliciosus]